MAWTSPARVGLGGDVILEVLGEPVTSAAGSSARAKMAALGSDDELSVKVMRGGEHVTLKKKLSDLQ